MGRSSIPPFPPALEARRSLQKMSGIEHLMIAVVSTAFDDLRGHDTRQRDTAVKYFFSDPETHVLSFPICMSSDGLVRICRPSPADADLQCASSSRGGTELQPRRRV